MAWNEPDNKDPWGGGGGNRGNDGPPDLDEALKNMQKKLSGIFGGGGSGGKNSSKGSNSTLFAIILVIAAVAYAVAGVVVVNEQERLVVLKLGEFSAVKGPGFRWNPPFVSKAFTVNTTSIRSWATDEEVLSQDLNIVDVRLTVQYRVDDPKRYVMEIRDAEESLRQATDSALRHAVGTKTMHEVITKDRQTLALAVKELLQEYLNSYEAGLVISQVSVQEAKPPSSVQLAFDDVTSAVADKERYVEVARAYAEAEVPIAQGFATRVKEEAKAYKFKVITHAQGEAKRFEDLLVEYKKAPEVTRQRLYVDAMEKVMTASSKVMVDVEGGNNMLYLPLDKILSREGHSSTSGAAASSTGLSQSELDRVARQVEERLRRSNPIGSSRREGR